MSILPLLQFSTSNGNCDPKSQAWFLWHFPGSQYRFCMGTTSRTWTKISWPFLDLEAKGKAMSCAMLQFISFRILGLRFLFSKWTSKSVQTHSMIRYPAVKTRPVQRGEELFISYGSTWFKSRTDVRDESQNWMKMAWEFQSLVEIFDINPWICKNLLHFEIPEIFWVPSSPVLFLKGNKKDTKSEFFCARNITAKTVGR